MKNKGPIIGGIIGALVIIGFIAWGVFQSTTPGKYDQFAQCINDSGATFFGAWWCPHCQNQKKLFGKSANILPYEECATPDGNGVLQICKDNNIEGYPTWEFADGSRISGEVSFARLSEKTGCEIPAQQ